MKFINKAKKGMVLIMTTVILFIATSTVAVLSTFVLVSRNQKIEHEYVSRNKIALKNISYEIYHKLLLPYITEHIYSFENKQFYTFKTEDLANQQINYKADVVINCIPDKYTIVDNSINNGSYQFELVSHQIGDFTKEEIRDLTLITVVNFKVGNGTDYRNPKTYSIGEMRFS